MNTPTPAREGLPELPEPEGWLVRYGSGYECWNAYRDQQSAIDTGSQWRGIVETLYTAAQMLAFREEGIAAYIASQPTPGGEVDMSAEAYLAALPRPQPVDECQHKFERDQEATQHECCQKCGLVRGPAGDKVLELLREAHDSVKASTAEDGITENRREYRRNLAERLAAALNQEKNDGR